MDIKLNCSNPECQRRIAVEESMAGTTIECPACGISLVVPKSTTIKFTCANPECEQHISVDSSEAGRFVRCPACDKPNQIPGTPPKPIVTHTPAQPQAVAAPPGPSPLHGAVPRRWRRLVMVWGLSAIVLVLVAGGARWHASRELPPNFTAIVEEICSVSEIRAAPVINHARTKLLFARNLQTGLGIFLTDLKTLERTRLELLDAPEHVRTDFFNLIGWSPDDHSVAFSLTYDAEQPNRHIMICDSDTGVVRKTIAVPDSVRQGVWLSDDTLVILDKGRRLYALNLAESTALGGYGRKGLRPLLTLDSGNVSYTLAKVSDRKVAYVNQGNVCVLDLPSHKTDTLTHFSSKPKLDWLDYSRASGEFLFSMTDESAGIDRCLFKFNPVKPAETALERLTTNGYALKGQWLDEGPGMAAVFGGPGMKPRLAVTPAAPADGTNLFIGGSIRSYSPSPDGTAMYAVASLTNEPMGIWEYDVPAHGLRNVVPAGSRPFEKSQAVAAIKVAADPSQGNAGYYYLPPAGMVAGKKYPVVICTPRDSRWSADSQILANAGIFFVSVNRSGLDSSDDMSTAVADIVKVHADLLKNPNVDPHRIYVAGNSATTTVVKELLQGHPALWRGGIYLSPVSFPDLSSTGAKLSCFISVGDEDAESITRGVQDFVRRAGASRVPVRVVYHQNAAHILANTDLVRDRYSALAEYILEDW